MKNETIYLAGGCLWGVEAFFRTIPGVVKTQAGRANGKTKDLEGEYDGYAECVKTTFDSTQLSIFQLLTYFFEIIDPFSLNQQGCDVGEKYRTGIYSKNEQHLEKSREFIKTQDNPEEIKVEVKPLSNYIKSAEIHQNHLERFPEDRKLCHLTDELLQKYASHVVEN